MAYFDENGKEVDGLMTSDEVQAKIAETQAAIEAEYNEKVAASNVKIGELQTTLATLNEQIAAGKKDPEGSDKEENLANLRKKLETTEASLEAERTKNAERLAGLESARMTDLMKSVAGDNPDLISKMKDHFDNTLSGMKGESEDELKKKIEVAYKLSADEGAGPTKMDNALKGGFGLPVGGGSNEGPRPFTENEKSLGEKMGITDADREKYASRLKTK